MTFSSLESGIRRNLQDDLEEGRLPMHSIQLSHQPDNSRHHLERPNIEISRKKRCLPDDRSIFGKIMKIEIYVADVTLFYENLKIVPALISGELQTICYLC